MFGCGSSFVDVFSVFVSRVVGCVVLEQGCVNLVESSRLWLFSVDLSRISGRVGLVICLSCLVLLGYVGSNKLSYLLGFWRETSRRISWKSSVTFSPLLLLIMEEPELGLV